MVHQRTLRPLCEHFADQLERAFSGGAWHGPSVLEALAGVDAATANARPLAVRHSIGELVLHLATWIEVARQRIAGETSAGVTDEEDWPTAGVSEAAWKHGLAQLEAAHERLLAAVATLDDSRLDDPVPGSDPTIRGLLFGVLQHNVYHAGQIALLRSGLEGGGGD